MGQAHPGDSFEPSSGTRDGPVPAFDVLIVGAGFAGLYMLHRARQLGLSARVFEAASGVGGTWYWNRYPGARCDIESLEYSYAFSEALQQEWHWSERYATQAEILRYAEHVADRFDLRRDIRFDTRVVSGDFDEARGRWTVRTDGGEEACAQFLVMATGPLSTANVPSLEGLASFAGRTFHTGRWPHEPVDFHGRRVGIVGTGSSAVQMVPIVAHQARQLVVFQRTPAYAVPAHNGPMDPAHEARIKADYAGFRARNRRMISGFGSGVPRHPVSALDVPPEERARVFEERWRIGGFAFGSAFNDLILDERANATAAQFIRDKIRATVHDPAVARRLMPRHAVMCKRLCVDSGYYETFNRPNVRLVDLNEHPLEAVTPGGIRAGGEEHALDDLVFATGFDAVTGTLLGMDLHGRGGLSLREKWRAGPVNYLGLGTAGFPNFFMLVGPGSVSAFTNVIVQIEQQVEWVGDCIAALRARGLATIEPTRDAEDAWVAHVNAAMSRTIYPTCNSWYVGANIPGKPRMMMVLMGFPAYAQKCDEVAARGYEGFRLGAA